MALSWVWSDTFACWYSRCGPYVGPIPPDVPYASSASLPADCEEIDFVVTSVDKSPASGSDWPYNTTYASSFTERADPVAGQFNSGLTVPGDAPFYILFNELGYGTDGSTPPLETPEHFLPPGYAATPSAGHDPTLASDLTSNGTTAVGSTGVTLADDADIHWYRFKAGDTDAYTLTFSTGSSVIPYRVMTYWGATGDGLGLTLIETDFSPAPSDLVVTGTVPAGGVWLYARVDEGGGGRSDLALTLDWTTGGAGGDLPLTPHELVGVAAVDVELALTGTVVLTPHELVDAIEVTAGEVGPNTLPLPLAELCDVVALDAALGGTLTTERVLIQNPRVRAPVLARIPNLGDNAPIALGLQLHGSITTELPDLIDLEELQTRSLAGTVLTLPTPVIVEGRPTLPAYAARSESAGVAIQGPAHIHGIADPDPVWNPLTSGWLAPPPAGGVGDARWTVQTLPTPPAGGYYWLGEPSALDGTRGIGTGARHWAPDRSTPGAPSWHSFFPFKPSVRAADSFLPGGSVVHHPKGVHFNSRFIEHMWCDFGSDRRQPFSFVIAAMIASFPSPGYTHYLLDAGRDPDSVGFPRISDSATGTPRAIADGLNYRQLISASPSMLAMATDPHGVGTTVLTRIDASRRPKMYYAIFNGARSTVGVRDPGAHRRHTGAVSAPASQHHRYFVLGRRQNRIAQGDACHLIVFEIRYWHRALSPVELDEQYGQLSSTYKFNQYRAL